MTLNEPLLSGWPDEKTPPSVQDVDENESPKARQKAPSRLGRVGSLVLGLAVLAAVVFAIRGRINSARPGGEPLYMPTKDRAVKNFKEVRRRLLNFLDFFDYCCSIFLLLLFLEKNSTLCLFNGRHATYIILTISRCGLWF